MIRKINNYIKNNKDKVVLGYLIFILLVGVVSVAGGLILYSSVAGCDNELVTISDWQVVYNQDWEEMNDDLYIVANTGVKNNLQLIFERNDSTIGVAEFYDNRMPIEIKETLPVGMEVFVSWCNMTNDKGDSQIVANGVFHANKINKIIFG